MPEFVTTKQAAALITDGSTVIVEGFIGTGSPEELLIRLRERFQFTDSPRDLTVILSSGIGDGGELGLNQLALEGLLKKVVAGHWGLTPKLAPLVVENKIEAYNLPQGVLTQLFRDTAAKRPCLVTHVGLGTFVDPRHEGGKMNEISHEDFVSELEIAGERYLAYKTFTPDFCLLKGTYADEDGNISFEQEPLTLGALAIAMATRNHGGKVIVQCRRTIAGGSIDPKLVTIPGLLVDYVALVSDLSNHRETYGTDYNPDFLDSRVLVHKVEGEFPLDARKVIARRCAMLFDRSKKIVNYGIGTPESIATVLKEEGVEAGFIPTVEPGVFGGTPQGGLDFGTSIAPESIIDQPYMFDFYDGGGIDLAFLGLAECDAEGNINVSRFGSKIAGCGGFINITQNADVVVFCGTFTARGLSLEIGGGTLKIAREGSARKFVQEVGQITFSGEEARHHGKTVYYVTERAVFQLLPGGITLIEIAPGVDLQRDVLDQMDFVPQIAVPLGSMDKRIFIDDLMGLQI
ncbi:MAG: acyl CoA:acetate/3-ketoacid CoA transferase [Candidatus Nanopelagicales bacterium]